MRTLTLLSLKAIGLHILRKTASEIQLDLRM